MRGGTKRGGRRLIGEGKWMREEEKEEKNDFNICRYWKERNTAR